MKVAGIDVSHKTITRVIDRDGQPGKPREFKNTPAGHVALSKVLCKAPVSRVGLEATGWYHIDPALALDDAGLALMVINPKAAKRFAEARPSMPPSWPNSPCACPSPPGNAPMPWL
ncbi:IS110 family transposase [Candidatus Thiosymbion oneisti]|uniref:IS110 family transposase n=1 Tax=Candidatus Thiosymbion oneisti TaxID=589554 RepID=UPI0014150F99|nr:transposase [Candidatus Thiosymbion oneisti]